MKRTLLVWLVVAVVYWSISMFVYALRHPDLTQTQVLLHIVEAVTWQ